MLRCMQSSSMDNLNNGNSNELCVLERQRDMLQRLVQQHGQHQQQEEQLLQHCLQSVPNNVDAQRLMPASQSMTSENFNWPVKMDRCFDENLPNFSIYGEEQFGFASSSETNSRPFTSMPNSSLTAVKNVEDQGAAMADKENIASTKKRKAEFEVEEQCIDKRIEAEAEAGEAQSEITVKSERENSKENSKASEVKKPDYIHVRARRGQATDSHSLAERARREKISKKMRYLQDLVPGCNKVTGKAGMLDEIINYVQSLQKQVEFLSMKLGALNPRLDFNVDNLFAKELPAYMASFPTATTPLEMANSNYFQLNPLQQGATSCSVDIVTSCTQMVPQRRDMTSSISTPEVYLDSSCVPQVQQLPNWDPDWQNLYNGNFH